MRVCQPFDELMEFINHLSNPKYLSSLHCWNCRIRLDSVDASQHHKYNHQNIRMFLLKSYSLETTTSHSNRKKKTGQVQKGLNIMKMGYSQITLSLGHCDLQMILVSHRWMAALHGEIPYKLHCFQFHSNSC